MLCTRLEKPPYESLYKFESLTYQVGPNQGFNENQIKVYKKGNQKIYKKPKNAKVEISVTDPDDIYTSDVDKTLLTTKGAVTTKLMNVDHVVEKAKGGCNSCLNAQIIAESENVGTQYTGKKWIWDSDDLKYY